jgi:hypothetical protein
MRWLVGWVLIFGSAGSLLAFNGHQASEGPLTLVLGDVPLIRSADAIQTLRISLTNRSESVLRIQLRMGGWVDPCRGLGPTNLSLELAGHAAAARDVSFTFGPGALSAHYPVHAYAEFSDPGTRETRTAHAVQIVEVRLAPVADAAAPSATGISVPADGSLALVKTAGCRPAWQWVKGEVHPMPAGWEGSDPESLCYFQRGSFTRGQSRAALFVHPPYRKGPGALFLDYALRLPRAQAIRLRFFNAIRDVAPTEPPSDGATFRVWVDDEKVFERHTASTTWVPGEAELSRWAGKTIRLRLEVHPGPRLDTTCDLGFWGDPIVLVGDPGKDAEPGEFELRAARARSAVQLGEPGPGVHVFPLADGVRAALVPGSRGILDAALAFGSARGVVVVRGFDLSLEGEKVGAWESSARLESVDVARSGGRLELRHGFRLEREFDRNGRRIPAKRARATLTARCWVEGAGLRVKFDADARLTDVAVGSTDQLAEKVYYGHGYVIARPQKFRADGGGHNLSTSHVGCDFASGVSLLQACDTPPDYLLVDPAEKLYALHTHPAATFTFVAGHGTALDCAVKYRPLFARAPAPAVAKKAGRFVFDLWGPRYAENTASLKQCFDYGVTNAMAILHVWQRWGYDYRLPDIFPPDPGLGTTDDLRQLGEACRQAGVLWGLHDNYIDFYPDADNFSYDHITFDAAGQPRRGWLNEGRDAQAYQFRPDHVRPFLTRNLRLIVPALKPTGSFVDVWTSMNAFDYFDRSGRWHSNLETLRCWGEAFAQIRTATGGGPTTSEAGSDQLIGWLDGADCQLMHLTPRGGRFSNIVPCGDWEQVPWFDLVNHTRFSLHGVGYSDRYQSGRSRDDHGIESDDYLSAEILTGHALMADLAMMPRGAVRKCWLAQAFIEKVALDEIAAVEHAGGNLHRVVVRWASGASAHVNRGTNDWAVEGRVLPPYGFLARAGDTEACVETIQGQVVEQSRSRHTRYVNARGGDGSLLPFSVAAERLEHLGGRDFRLVAKWQAAGPASRDLRVFYHFNRTTPGRYTDTEFYGGGDPPLPTTAWNGTIHTGTQWTLRVPEGFPLGEYEILCGLYDAKGNGARYRLSGDEREGRRYRVGLLQVEGQISEGRTNVTRIWMTPAIGAQSSPPPPRPRGVVDFGDVRTGHGLRWIEAPDHVLVVPLPGQGAFEVTLAVKTPTAAPDRPARLEAVDARGTVLRPVPCQTANGQVRFTTEPGVFGYRLGN